MASLSDFQPLVGHFCREVFWVARHVSMFRAIGFLIILWGLSQYFSASFAAADRTGVAVLETIEVAAEQSRTSMAESSNLLPTP